LAASNVILRT